MPHNIGSTSDLNEAEAGGNGDSGERIEGNAEARIEGNAEAKIEGNAEARIEGNAEALRILLGNLLDNAIRYTPPGGRIDVSVRPTMAAVELTVRDSGPGIPADQLTRVFDRFHRVPGNEATGSGLGLAIVKRIADSHGATVSLSNDQGLVATVVFPRV